MISLLLVFTFITITWGFPNTQVVNDETDQRIVGGVEVDIVDYPYQVLIDTDDQYCGGSIITEHHVLTAAHCFIHYVYRPEAVFVRVNTSIAFSGGEIYNVTKVAVHTLFYPDTLDYDVAVLELTSRIIFGSGVRPISLPKASSQKLAQGSELTMTGWGSKNSYLGFSETLRAVNVSLINYDECLNTFREIGLLVTDRMVCAESSDTAHKGTCRGDSGSPLFTNGFQYGITSWTEGSCADQGYPSVFVDVIAIRDFITNVTGI